MADLRLEELNATNAVAANGLTLRRGQEAFVTPPSYAIADAWINPATTWANVVVDGDTVVGFIRANFDAEAPQEEFRSCVWRINVAADAQGMGIGRFAVLGAADEARRRGLSRLTVLWEPGDEGPDAFFRAVGFEVIGETAYGENIGALSL